MKISTTAVKGLFSVMAELVTTAYTTLVTESGLKSKYEQLISSLGDST